MNTKHYRLSIMLAGILLSFFLGACASRASLKSPSALQVESKQPFSLINAFGLSDKPLGEIDLSVARDVVQCMAKRGFSYVDPTNVVFNDQYTTIGAYWRYSTRDGYGVADYLISQMSNSSHVFEDPNFGYVTRLPVSQRASYWRALTGVGKQPNVDQILLPNRVPAPAPGCENESLRKELGTLPWFSPTIGPKLRALSQKEFNSPSLSGPVRDWAACLASSGIIVKSYNGAANQIVAASHQINSVQKAQQLRIREIRTATIDAQCYIRYLHAPQRKWETLQLFRLIQSYPSYKLELKAALKS